LESCAFASQILNCFIEAFFRKEDIALTNIDQGRQALPADRSAPI